MIHNQIEINQVQGYKAKGTDKRNADINVCSGIGFIQHFGKSKCRSDNMEKVEVREPSTKGSSGRRPTGVGRTDRVV